ncbi:MAG TPA: hypothetical protein VHP14_23710, partial [Anaerolineales bacterium]|nr:hypothetical protein [Anaerolineales bacterium]
MNERMKNFWAGVRAEIPLLIGVFPFGLIYGALALEAGLSPAASQMMFISAPPLRIFCPPEL